VNRPRILIFTLLFLGCGHGLDPVGPGSTGLGGRVTLQGAWPIDTGVVAVALFVDEPTSNLSDLPVIFTEAPEPDSTSFEYLWDIAAGEYGYLVVAWMREGANIFDISSWVVIGFYADPGSPTEPAPVLIIPGTLRTIDLIGDFSLVPAPVAGEGSPR